MTREWLYLISAIIQSNNLLDLAEILTNDYISYIQSQGATADYTTIYNIYKDEYLTDPDKDKMVEWYDFRAGKKMSGTTVQFIYSLIPPYRTNINIGTATLSNGDRIVNGSIQNMPLSYMNTNLNRGLRVVTKMNIIGPTPTTLYGLTSYGENNLSTTYHIRFNTLGNRRRSWFGIIIDNVRVGTDNSPAINLNNGMYIFEQSLDPINRTHTMKTLNTSDYNRTISLPTGTFGGIYPFSATNALRLFGFSYNELLYHKIYYLI